MSEHTESRAHWLRHAVATVARLVPPGHIVAYGDIAELLGVGPRQVGAITAAGPAAGEADVPWWRVTNSHGDLPMHLTDEATARWRQEGIPLKRNGRGASIRTHRADLSTLADAAESALGPLPGATGYPAECRQMPRTSTAPGEPTGTGNGQDRDERQQRT